jgi:hypothetical protein
MQSKYIACGHVKGAVMNSVETTISDLRGLVGAKNDAELARQLQIDQSTISSWRSRGRVPSRFTKLLETAPVPQDEVWPELTDRGTAIALARYAILRNEVVMSGNLDLAIPAFLDVKPFWLVMHRAVFELRGKMDALKVDLKTAAALLLQEDLRAPKETAQRVAAMLAEDFADNPFLQEWK